MQNLKNNETRPELSGYSKKVCIWKTAKLSTISTNLQLLQLTIY